MSPSLRGIFLASLSLTVLALGACSSTGQNRSNVSDANRVDSILERAAREAKASGNKAETVVLLEKIYQRNPDDAAVATSFGQALREDEQLNRARQILFPFTEGKNAYPDAVVELAMVQLALGQYKEAELTSRRGVELDPKSGRAFLALGTALDAQNYHEQAEIAFRRGIDNWKGDPAPIMNNLALNLASQNKLDQAIDMLLKAKEISPGRTEIERNLRIIRTLQESADDFIIKQQATKNPAAKPSTTETKKENAVTVKSEDKSKETKPKDVKKDEKPAVEKKAEDKKVEKPVLKTPVPEKPKSSQNFNKKAE